MSKGPENTFIGSVHRHLPAGLYHMKNHNQFNAGIADVWYSGVLSDLWVEYKWLEIPKRGSTVIDLCAPKFLTVLQQQWLTDRCIEGRKVAVIVGSKDGGAVFNNLTWKTPLTAEAFSDRVATRKSVADWIASMTNG